MTEKMWPSAIRHNSRCCCFFSLYFDSHAIERKKKRRPAVCLLHKSANCPICLASRIDEWSLWHKFLKPSKDSNTFMIILKPYIPNQWARITLSIRTRREGHDSSGKKKKKKKQTHWMENIEPTASSENNSLIFSFPIDDHNSFSVSRSSRSDPSSFGVFRKNSALNRECANERECPRRACMSTCICNHIYCVHACSTYVRIN